MAHVLFYASMLAVAGTLIIPLTSETMDKALYHWCIQLLASGAFSYANSSYFPSWEEPQWHQEAAYSVTAWALVIAGLIVAFCKPRKRNTPVA